MKRYRTNKCRWLRYCGFIVDWFEEPPSSSIMRFQAGKMDIAKHAYSKECWSTRLCAKNCATAQKGTRSTEVCCCPTQTAGNTKGTAPKSHRRINMTTMSIGI